LGLETTQEVFSMCDYSLHNVRSRPAKVGDKLTTCNFNTGTRGFAAPEDATMAVCTAAILNRRCPLWVKSGHSPRFVRCPLYPQKRTLVKRVGMSALCQKRTFCAAVRDVRFVPKTHMTTGLHNVCFHPGFGLSQGSIQ